MRSKLKTELYRYGRNNKPNTARIALLREEEMEVNGEKQKTWREVASVGYDISTPIGKYDYQTDWMEMLVEFNTYGDNSVEELMDLRYRQELAKIKREEAK